MRVVEVEDGVLEDVDQDVDGVDEEEGEFEDLFDEVEDGFGAVLADEVADAREHEEGVAQVH